MTMKFSTKTIVILALIAAAAIGIDVSTELDMVQGVVDSVTNLLDSIADISGTD